ncbi:hypothetical protein HCN44_011030 [Aphidius gifuensis]|uniref:Uncharacterized protein n=1 Tax=Aphidius gifuensis TaxID=684658 RepID=A0A834Y6C2_APHGI|nr:hypothetical protein HCN44_011030 [Aphidius gifuensis]
MKLDHETMIARLHETFDLVRVNLAKAYTNQEKNYRKKHREWRPRVGDKVRVLLHLLSKAIDGINAKLMPKYSEIYKVVKILSPVRVMVSNSQGENPGKKVSIGGVYVNSMNNIEDKNKEQRQKLKSKTLLSECHHYSRLRVMKKMTKKVEDEKKIIYNKCLAIKENEFNEFESKKEIEVQEYIEIKKKINKSVHQNNNNKHREYKEYKLEKKAELLKNSEIIKELEIEKPIEKKKNN